MQPYGYVYRWDNLINGKSYIGSHNGQKKDYIGSGTIFNNAWSKYPEDCWVRTILYRGPDFRQRETEWIIKENAIHSDLYYNLMHWTEGYCEISEETKLKISSSLKGQKFSPERCSNISKSLTGKKKPPCTEENRLNLSKSLTGKKHTVEHRMAVSMGRTGKNKKPQTIIECPHCGKRGGKSLIHRWHFNNCKKKEFNIWHYSHHGERNHQ